MLEHFAQARERVKAGETVEDALRTFDLAAAGPFTDTQTQLDAKQVLSHLERVLASNERLEAEVAALREKVEQLAEARVLPPDATPERIDRALEVEMLKGSEIVNDPEPRRGERESWIAEATLEARAGASELPAAPGEGGLIVRAAVWLERPIRSRPTWLPKHRGRPAAHSAAGRTILV